jgi:hypothetical protein
MSISRGALAMEWSARSRRATCSGGSANGSSCRPGELQNRHTAREKGGRIGGRHFADGLLRGIAAGRPVMRDRSWTVVAGPSDSKVPREPLRRFAACRRR